MGLLRVSPPASLFQYLHRSRDKWFQAHTVVFLLLMKTLRQKKKSSPPRKCPVSPSLYQAVWPASVTGTERNPFALMTHTISVASEQTSVMLTPLWELLSSLLYCRDLTDSPSHPSGPSSSAVPSCNPSQGSLPRATLEFSESGVTRNVGTRHQSLVHQGHKKWRAQQKTVFTNTHPCSSYMAIQRHLKKFLFCFAFLKQDFTLYPRLASGLLCSPDWLQIHGSPTSASQVLEL